jgi:hypothetical protein
LGNYTSRIDINVDIDQYWTNLLFFACHEGYPGHHTDRCVKDLILFRKNGYFENCVALIYTPEFVIYEGMGEVAQDVIFDIMEIAEISFSNFCLNIDNNDDLETLIQPYEIKRGFRGFNQNFAFHKHIDGWTDKKLFSYCNEFKLLSKSNIRGRKKFYI